jgi:hypothetical protein
MDASFLTRQRREKAIYANYLEQTQKLQGGCLSGNVSYGSIGGYAVNLAAGSQLICKDSCVNMTCPSVPDPVYIPPSGLPSVSLWFDPSDTDYYTTSGGLLSAFTDKSGNGNNGIGYRSQFNVNPINGLGTVRFIGQGEGDPQYMKVTTANFNDPTITYALVVRWNSGSSGFMGTDTPGQYGRGVGVYEGDIQVIYNDNFEVMSPSFPLTAGQPFILVCQFSNGPNNDLTPGEIRISVNGIIQSYERNQDQPDNTEGLNFGCWNPTNTGDINFDMGEALVYTSQLTTLERQKVEGYLAWKWGLAGSLPSGHPYKNAAP